MSGSCVTSTIVSPSRLSRCRRASTSTLVRVSRLPVGSSARITAGSLTSARAMATRCCWPPESWLGWWSARSARPTAARRARARVLRSRAVSAGVEQGQLDVLERGRARQQVELLEDESDLGVADPAPARPRRGRRRPRRRARSRRRSACRGSPAGS